MLDAVTVRKHSSFSCRGRGRRGFGRTREVFWKRHLAYIHIRIYIHVHTYADYVRVKGLKFEVQKDFWRMRVLISFPSHIKTAQSTHRILIRRHKLHAQLPLPFCDWSERKFCSLKVNNVPPGGASRTTTIGCQSLCAITRQPLLLGLYSINRWYNVWVHIFWCYINAWYV